MLIDISYEAVCDIVTQNLKESFQSLEADYQARKNGRGYKVSDQTEFVKKHFGVK